MTVGPLPVVSKAQLRLASLRASCEFMGIILNEERERALFPRPKEKYLFGGPRAAKSTLSMLEIAGDVKFWLDEKRKWVYWVVIPNYKAEMLEMEYLEAWARKMGILSKRHWPQNDSVTLTLLDSVVVQTKTAEKPELIASEAVDGIVLAEAGQMSEDVLKAARTRLLDRNGWLVANGTLEDLNRSQWAWFGDLGAKLLEKPEPGKLAVSLPTWSNPFLFPEGRATPEKDLLTGEPTGRLYFDVLLEQEGEFAFNRRYAGIPSGVPDQIYEQLSWGDWCYRGDPGQDVWVKSAGGWDYGAGGTNHPAALVAVTVNQDNIAVVRDAWKDGSGDHRQQQLRRRSWSMEYGIPLGLGRWGMDAAQGQAARELGEYACRTGAGARDYRVGLMQSRIRSRSILWDMEPHSGHPEEKARAERVKEAFEEAEKVHWYKRPITGHGEKYDYAKVNDDLTAATEDAIEVLDGKRSFDVSKGLPRQPLSFVRKG